MANDLDEFLNLVGSKPVRGGTSETPYLQAANANSVQWQVLGDNKFLPTGESVKTLAAGAYKPEVDNRDRLVLTKINLITDELIRLPDTASSKVLESIQSFWLKKESFAENKQIFKRGVLLWGPPGSGKTVTVMLLIEDIIARNGIVVVCQHPELTIKALDEIRKIEKDRCIICVMEDIDEMIEKYGETHILSLLDGESQIDNVVHLATTNYPQNLDPRLINRPSRFDEVIKIDMPSVAARRSYLQSKIKDNDAELEKWITDTEKFSIAHMRELFVAVKCLGRDYDETIGRLKKMGSLLNKSLGFGS